MEARFSSSCRPARLLADSQSCFLPVLTRSSAQLTLITETWRHEDAFGEDFSNCPGKVSSHVGFRHVSQGSRVETGANKIGVCVYCQENDLRRAASLLENIGSLEPAPDWHRYIRYDYIGLQFPGSLDKRLSIPYLAYDLKSCFEETGDDLWQARVIIGKEYCLLIQWNHLPEGGSDLNRAAFN